MIEVAALAEGVPPRPQGVVPEVGLTCLHKVIWLRPMSRKQWDALGITAVTGRGWVAWYPVEHRDMLAIATRRKGKGKGEAKKEKGSPGRLPADDYLTRPGA
jgi:hypothetical protein